MIFIMLLFSERFKKRTGIRISFFNGEPKELFKTAMRYTWGNSRSEKGFRL